MLTLKIARLVRLATLPETRRAIIAAARSDRLRDVAHRAATDRASLARDLMNPANAAEIIRDVVRHPASRELGSAGLLFLPGRFLPLGMAASWAGARVLRRFGDAPIQSWTRRPSEPGVRPRDVTPTRREDGA
jgi:hypothetical protein